MKKDSLFLSNFISAKSDNNKFLFATKCAFLIWCIINLVACASVSVEPGKTISKTDSLEPPSIIYIKRFDTSSGKWEGAVSGQTARERIANSLAENLESRIGEVVTTKLIDEDEPTANDGWLVTGSFKRVNPGGKWTRFVIGLGAGGSKFETEVYVYNLTDSSTEPIMIFETTGGSNIEGGAATFNDATFDDINRTAREIRDYLQKQFQILKSRT